MSLETHRQQLAAIVDRICAEHPDGIYDEDGILIRRVEASIQKVVDEMDIGDTLWHFVRPLKEYPRAVAIDEATTPLETMKCTAFFYISDAIHDAVPTHPA